MKRLVRLFIVILCVYIVFNAYQDTQKNKKSIWYNIAYQGKKVVDFGVEKTKSVVNEFKSGLKN